jgi:hypothetical protein
LARLLLAPLLLLPGFLLSTLLLLARLLLATLLLLTRLLLATLLLPGLLVRILIHTFLSKFSFGALHTTVSRRVQLVAPMKTGNAYRMLLFQ